MKKTLFIITLALGLSACGNTPTKPNQSNSLTPEWFLQVQSDQGAYIYGVGQGKSRENAIQNALGDLTSKLGVQVNAKFESQLTVKDRGYELIQRDGRKQVTTQSIMNLSQYDVIKLAAPLPTKVYAQVRSDKHLLFKSSLKRLKNFEKTYQQQADLVKNSALQRYLLAKNTVNQLEEHQKLTSLCQVLNPSWNAQPAFDFEKHLQTDFANVKQALSFQIVTKNNQVWPFVPALEDALGQENLLKKDGEIRVEVVSQPSYSQAYGFHIARHQIGFKVIENNQVISHNQIEVKGQAPANQKAANLFASKNFQSQLNKIGIWQLLNLTTETPE